MAIVIIPDYWVVVKFIIPSRTMYKVLAGWSGSYLYGTSWKMNSGIAKVKQDDKYYEFEGYSGSVYQCSKNRYGRNQIMINVFETIKAELQKVPGASVEILPEETDFSSITY
jgi:hypothetical protein